MDTAPLAIVAHSEWTWTPAELGVGGKQRKFVLSRGQVAWAMADAFLRPGAGPWGRMNWSRLEGWPAAVAAERLRCLQDYFERVMQECDMTTLIEYEWINQKDDADLDMAMRVDHVEIHEGRMEEADGAGAIVDFANSKLHIHSIIASVTQEELIFSTHSECFLGLTLFPDEMGDDDCIVMRNVWRHANYTGYLDSFRYAGPAVPSVFVDVIAIDASAGAQWTYGVQRDIHKAHMGFSAVSSLHISTGNWGCGAFGGDPMLKLLQQTLAAQLAGKVLRYSTFGNHKQALEFRSLLEAIAKTPGVTCRWMRWILAMYDPFPFTQSCDLYVRSNLMLKELRGE